MRVRLRRHRGAVPVIRDGLGHRPDAMAGHAQPPPEVDIVVVGEQGRIEAAGVLVGPSGHGEGAAIREEGLGQCHAGGVGLAVLLLIAAGFEAGGAAHEVDGAAIPAHHARADAGRLIIEALDQTRDEARLELHVVVDEQEDVARGGRDAGGVAAREPEVLGQGDHAHRREVLGEMGPAVVGGAVVHADQLEQRGRVVAGDQRGEAVVEVCPSVPVDDDHRDPGARRRQPRRDVRPCRLGRGDVWRAGQPTGVA